MRVFHTLALFVLCVPASLFAQSPTPGPGAAATRGPEGPIATAIAEIVKKAHHPKLKWPEFPHYRDELERFYGETAYQPAWIEVSGARKQAGDVLSVLDVSATRGLPPEDYDVTYLEQSLKNLGPATPPQDVAFLDAALTLLLMRHISDVHIGRINPKNLGLGYSIEQKKYELASLVRGGIEKDRIRQIVSEAEPEFLQYRKLKGALAALQAALKGGAMPPLKDVTQKKVLPALAERIRMVELALERIRWFPDVRDRKAIVANIPAFRLAGFDAGTKDGKAALGMNIVVGKAMRTETPVFSGDMRFIVFRPYWYPPYSIIKKEIVPGIKRDGKYIQKHNMEIVAGMNDDAPALPASAENVQKVLAGSLRIRQKPGPKNSLGLAKFMFPNSHSVYLHGTPAQALFAKPRRDFSHGCVRVEDPAALALWALADQPEWTAEKIKAAMNGSKPVRVDLQTPIPVLLFYTTVIVLPDDTIAFYEDIYGMDKDLDVALKAGEPYQP